MIERLLASLTGNKGAILISSDESGGVSKMYNWELYGEVAIDVPIALGVPASWGAKLRALPAATLQAASLKAHLDILPVQRDADVNATCLRGHADFFVHSLGDDVSGPLTITVTPIFGDPDVYVRAVSDTTSTDVAWRFHADFYQESPGDDALSFTLSAPKRVALISIVCAADSNYTMTLSTRDSLIPLTNGMPKRFEALAAESRYFTAVVPGTAPLNVTVTPLSGDPDLYISTTTQRPYAAVAQWNSSSARKRYEFVNIASNDPNRCLRVATCTFYIAVMANDAPSSFSVVATWADTPATLVAGMPQAGAIESENEPRYYVAHAASSTADLSITLVLAYGAAHVYVNPKTPAPTPQQSVWSSAPLTARSEGLTIPHTDPKFCGACEYHVSVVAASASVEYTLTVPSRRAPNTRAAPARRAPPPRPRRAQVSSSSMLTVLEDGSPLSETLAPNAWAYFKLLVPPSLVDVQVAVVVPSCCCAGLPSCQQA